MKKFLNKYLDTPAHVAELYASLTSVSIAVMNIGLDKYFLSFCYICLAVAWAYLYAADIEED